MRAIMEMPRNRKRSRRHFTSWRRELQALLDHLELAGPAVTPERLDGAPAVGHQVGRQLVQREPAELQRFAWIELRLAARLAGVEHDGDALRPIAVGERDGLVPRI